MAAMGLFTMSIEQVQKWVVTFLICAVSAFPTGAIIAQVHQFADHRRADAVVLLVVLSILDLIALIAIRIVHQASPLHWVLLLAPIPALTAAVFAL